jgi:DNA-binding XRE family transcriptional regulator
MADNKLRQYRESRLISQSQLARMAEISPITISRVEKGYACRWTTKRKILLALGLPFSDQDKIFDA